MEFREKTLKDILGLKPKSSSKIDYDDSNIFMDILRGEPIPKILKQSNYSTKRSLDTAIHQKKLFPLLDSKIIFPLHGNKIAQTLLDFNSIDIKDKKWKKISNLPSIIDSLGFRVHSSEIDQSTYSIFQDLDFYQYKNIIDFVENSSSSVLKRIEKIDKSEHLIEKDKDKIDYWREELQIPLDKLDKITRLENDGNLSFKNIEDIIEILKRLIEISCDYKMVYCLPNVLRRIGTCYYYIGAYVDCIAIFDFAISVAKYSENPKKQKHLASTWIASSIRKIFDRTDYFIEKPEKFELAYQLVKNLNRRAFEDYQYSSEIKIEPMWNLCYLELSLISSYHKMGINNSTDQVSKACDRLYEFIGNIKRKSTNYSGNVKYDIIKDLDAISNDIRHETEMLNMSNDFISLSEQLRNL
jgi:tetratricopeptide (TPR) repeat protein